MNNKKLKKRIDKLYHKTNQRLIVTTHCLFNKKWDYSADIFAVDKPENIYGKDSIYLFSIQTQDVFYELLKLPEWSEKRLLKDCEFKTTSELWRVAHTPYFQTYPDGFKSFTLKKFGNIEKDDIESCLRYYLKKVLDYYFPVNLKVIIEYEKEESK